MVKKINEIQKAINKAHSNTLIKMTDDALEVERIPTGILALDQILSGGFALGQWVELFGNPGSGKTSIAMKFLGEAQKRGNCVLIDLEGAFDPHVAATSGVNVKDLWFAQPETAEDTFEVIEQVYEADDVVCIVVDSVAGLVPKAEAEGDFGDSHVGLVARLISQASRKLEAQRRKTETPIIIIWINQVREKIGMMGYGPQSESTGGRSLKFWCSTRLDVSRVGAVKQGDDIIGQTVKAKTMKHRSGAPFQQCTFDILYETGISNESTLVDLAVKSGLIVKSGAWMTFTSTGEKVQGKQAALDVLANDQALYDSILKEIQNG